MVVGAMPRVSQTPRRFDHLHLQNGAAALLPLLLLAACSSVHVANKQGVQLPALEFPLRSFTYPSGLRVLVERDTRTPLAGVYLVVGTGSTSDPAGKEGLAHSIEHLTFRSQPGGAGNFGNQLEDAGVINRNAFTTLDSTVYHEIGLASDLPKILRLEGLRMRSPVVAVPEAVQATEMEVVRNELRQRNETGFVGEVLGELQAALFPPGHPYARGAIGTHQSLSALGNADVLAFVKAWYRPDNMTLLVLGNVELESADRLLADALPRELLEGAAPVRLLKRMPPAAPPVPPSPPQQKELPRREALVAAPELWLAWSLPRNEHRRVSLGTPAVPRIAFRRATFRQSREPAWSRPWTREWSVSTWTQKCVNISLRGSGISLRCPGVRSTTTTRSISIS